MGTGRSTTLRWSNLGAMLKLYTSYFAQLRNFPNNLVGLSTAVWNPKWLQPNRDKNGTLWLDIPPLKPDKNCVGLCNGQCNPKHPNNCEFLKQYYKQLKAIDINNFITKLNNLKLQIEQGEHLNNIEFAFLVYETPTNPCSERVIIQTWLQENKIPIEEWKYTR